MIGEDACREALQQALEISGVDEVEAYLSAQDLALTRFARSSIHQNVAQADAVLHVRAVIGRRQGRATTNDLSRAGVARAAQEAGASALLMPEDPDFKGLPDPNDPPQVSAYDEPTGLCGPEVRARIVEQICRLAEAQALEVAGFCRTGTQEIAVMSSRGARTYHRGTFAGLLITAMSDTSAGWSKGGSWRLVDLDVEALFGTHLFRPWELPHGRPRG